MIRIFKKSDLRNLVSIPLIFAVFLLSRPALSHFIDVESDWLESLRGMAAVVTVVLAVYFAVIILRIRDHRHEVTRLKQGNLETTAVREPPT